MNFERLLAEISTLFINLPADRIDGEIGVVQQSICDLLDIDRSTLWIVPEDDPGVLALARIHQTPEMPNLPAKMKAGDFFPWTTQKLLKGETVVLSKLTELPAEADRDLETYHVYRAQSTVSVPLSVGGGDVFGALTFTMTERGRDWSESIVQQFQLVAQIFANALARKQNEKALAAQLKFETLLADISAHFLNLPPELVDSAIEDAQRRVCKCLGLDRSALFQISRENADTLLLTHLHQSPECPPPPERMDLKEVAPWALGKIISGQTLVVSKTDDLPASADRDRQSFAHYGTRSVVGVPLSVGGDAIMGLLTFALVGRERAWPDAVVQQFELVAQTFANALARKQAEEELAERLQFETLLTDISTSFVNLPSNKVDSAIEDAQRRVCELLGLDRSNLFQIDEGDPATLLRTHIYEPPGSRIPPERMTLKEFFPWAMPKILGGETITISKMTDLPAEAGRDREIFGRYGTKSAVVVPLAVGRWKVFGLLSFALMREEREWTKRVVQQFQLVAQIFANALARKRVDKQLKKQLEEIEELKQRLEKENICLREELGQEKGFEKIIGGSEVLSFVLFRVGQVAPTDATVLILGETGTGKGMIANGIHGLSPRKERPMITVNCAALPANLIESELFGREKGAFTGAHTRQLGRFEAADGGTIFLDEIGELPLELQSKLLRVLQDGEFERLGSSRTVKVDVRVIASTSRDLKEEVRTGDFREDLFYRLNVFPVTIPPLRERADDIPELVRFFAEKYSRKIGKQVETIPKRTMKILQAYSWPGNVRELEHVIERSVIMAKDTVLRLADHLEPIRGAEAVDLSSRELAAVEREHIVRVLRDTGWKIEGRKGAAKILNLHPSTLRSRIKKLGIKRS